jgi:hypothetical protein
MQSCQADGPFSARKRKVQIIDMKMNDIEFFFGGENALQHQNVMGQAVNAFCVQPERFLAAGYKFRTC